MKAQLKIKNYIATIFFTALILSITACDDFLEENPKNFINPENFYQNQSDAEGGLTGIYAVLHSYGLFAGNSNGIIHMHHLMSEYTYPWSMTAPDVMYINYPDFKCVINIWTDCYDGLKRANSYIANLEDKEVDFSEELKNRYLGEARFIRSLMFYYLVQFYGDVPLVTEPFKGGDNFYVSKDPADKVWDFVMDDLDKAIEALPFKSEYSGADLARANKGAARTLKAKIHMIREEWSEAKTQVDAIISSGEYDLEPDILDNWRTANEHGVESIFEVDMGSGFFPRLGNSLFQLSGPSNYEHPITGNIVGGLWTGVAYSPFFYESFDNSDERKTKLFLDTAKHAGPAGRFFTGKYFDPSVMYQGQWMNAPVNVVVFRYSDILLMKAEIENEINSGPNAEAYDALDRVTGRVNATPYPRSMNYDEFLNAVFQERAKELFYEGHRFFDLKRRGLNFTKTIVENERKKLFEFVGFDGTIDIQQYMLKLPIPVQEMDANPNLEQNTGYND